MQIATALKNKIVHSIAWQLYEAVDVFFSVLCLWKGKSEEKDLKKSAFHSWSQYWQPHSCAVDVAVDTVWAFAKYGQKTWIFKSELSLYSWL